MSKSPSLRRIQADIRELSFDPSTAYHASPLENDMFEWHFTIRGADGTDFEGGVYHGRILLPPEYPFKPPHIMFLTPSGRFETNTKVCLSFSAYHPELWQPAWGIRLILEALISFLPTPADGAIGSLDWSSKERKKLAKQSQSWSCAHCGNIVDLLPKPKDNDKDQTSNETNKNNSLLAKQIEELHRLQKQTEANRVNTPTTEAPVSSTQSPPEEEIVFDNQTDHDDDDEEEEEEEESIVPQQEETAPTATLNDTDNRETGATVHGTPTTTTTTTTTTTITTTHDTTDEATTIASWWYDPLLNVMILLLLAICYLLLQKWFDLSNELKQLQFQAWEQAAEGQYMASNEEL